MTLDLNNLNPIGKIFFVLFELIALFLIKDKIFIFSVLTILAITFLLNSRLLKNSISAILRLSPLFFAILLLGFIFGTAWQRDLLIIVRIGILVCLTTILINTTSAYNFLKNLKGFLHYRFFDNFIIFIYGIINFIPVFYRQFSETIVAFRLQKGRKMKLSEIPSTFNSFLEKSMNKVKGLSFCSEILINSFPIKPVPGEAQESGITSVSPISSVSLYGMEFKSSDIIILSIIIIQIFLIAFR